MAVPGRDSAATGSMTTGSPRGSCAKLPSAFPAAKYTELPGLGHGAPLLAADQVNPILAEFLD